MQTQEKKSGSKIIIIILVLLLGALGFFTYQNYKKNAESQESLMTEKLEIQADLDAKILELDNAIADNTTMKDELIAAKNDIVMFRDSVKDLTTLKYQVIKRYKKKLAVLEDLNNKLLQESELLKQENYTLTVAVDSAQAEVQRRGTTIERKTYENDSLSNKNTDLTNTISKGAALQVSDVTIMAMKERRNGELKETSRAKRTNAFRIGFKVRENTIAKSGDKVVHIVIKDATGKVLGGLDSFTSDSGEKVNYSDTTVIDYENTDKDVIIITNIPKKSIGKGTFYVSVYLEKKLLSSGQITLK